MASKDVKTQRERRRCNVCTIVTNDYMTVYSEDTVRQIDSDLNLQNGLLGQFMTKTRIHVCDICLREREDRLAREQLARVKMDTSAFEFVSSSIDVPPDEPVNWRIQPKMEPVDVDEPVQSVQPESQTEEEFYANICRHKPIRIPETGNNSRFVLVDLDQLESLFNDVMTVCKTCMGLITHYKFRTISTCAEVFWRCGCDKVPGRSADFQNRWTSQKPMSGHEQEQLFEGNVSIGVSVLTNGFSYEKLYDFAKDIGLTLPPSNVHYRQRKELVAPILSDYFERKQNEYLELVVRQSKRLYGIDEQGRIQRLKAGVRGDVDQDMRNNGSVMRYLLKTQEGTTEERAEYYRISCLLHKNFNNELDDEKGDTAPLAEDIQIAGTSGRQSPVEEDSGCEEALSKIAASLSAARTTKTSGSSVDLANSLKMGLCVPKRGTENAKLLTMSSLLDWNEKAAWGLLDHLEKEQEEQEDAGVALREEDPEPPSKKTRLEKKEAKKQRRVARNQLPKFLFRKDINLLVLEHTRDRQANNKRNNKQCPKEVDMGNG